MVNNREKQQSEHSGYRTLRMDDTTQSSRKLYLIVALAVRDSVAVLLVEVKSVLHQEMH